LERFAGSNQTVARGTELLVRAHNAALKLTVGLRHLSRVTGVSWLEAARSLTPCWKGASLSGGSTGQSTERDPNLAVLPQKRRAAISRSWGDVGGFVALIRKQGGSSPFGVHGIAGNKGSWVRGRAGLVSSEVAAIGVVENAGLWREEKQWLR
jgi:hypothetical protein